MASGQETAHSLVAEVSRPHRGHRQERPGAARRASRSIPTRSRSPTSSTPSARASGPRGPLHGIPILIKDNIATADRMMTTAGSLALVGATPPTRRVHRRAAARTAGAVILGKTNLSEWANFRSTHSSSGWSGRGGQTKNPYALDRNPSGSSSGSGAAVAASLCGRRGRHRDGRLDRVAVEQQLARRHQADGRPGQPRRHRPDLAHARTRPARWRAPSPTRPSCSARWPAPIPTTPRRRRSAGKAAPRLHEVPRSRTG